MIELVSGTCKCHIAISIGMIDESNRAIKEIVAIKYNEEQVLDELHLIFNNEDNLEMHKREIVRFLSKTKLAGFDSYKEVCKLDLDLGCILNNKFYDVTERFRKRNIYDFKLAYENDFRNIKLNFDYNNHVGMCHIIHQIYMSDRVCNMLKNGRARVIIGDRVF